MFGPPAGPIERLLLVESGAREHGELILSRLAQQIGCASVHLLTCYESAPTALAQFTDARSFSVHAPEAVSDRTAYASELARRPYDAVIILTTGSGVLAKWKWLLLLKTKNRVAFADESGDWFFVTLRNPGPLAVLALRRTRIGSAPELLLALANLFLAPFVIAYLLIFALAVHMRRSTRRVRTTA